MDGGRRLAGAIGRSGAVGDKAGPGFARVLEGKDAPAQRAPALRRLARLSLARLVAIERGLPRFTSGAAVWLLFCASLGYGMVRGNHVGPVIETLKDARDAAANQHGHT